jgi:hypothetical protein
MVVVVKEAAGLLLEVEVAMPGAGSHRGGEWGPSLCSLDVRRRSRGIHIAKARTATVAREAGGGGGLTGTAVWWRVEPGERVRPKICARVVKIAGAAIVTGSGQQQSEDCARTVGQRHSEN